MTIDVDSLIFDMDGTLWDAVDSYCTVWNTTFSDLDIPHAPVTRELLLTMMGMHLEDIVARLADSVSDKSAFLERLDYNERTMMPSLGGVFYPGVRDTIETLAKHGLKLFMVSNCGSRGLENFITLAGIRPYISCALSHGATGQPKARNIARLIEEYHLKSPWYVGDTQGDSDAAHAAGAGMIWCAYGFGPVSDPDVTIHNFTDLLDVII